MVKCLTTLMAILVLASCSSPTKYTPRSSALPVVSSTSNAKAEKLYSDPSLSVSHVDNSPCGAVYRVKSGDSLSEIAYHCQVSMKQLAAFNKISPPYVIYKNQRLQMPEQTMQTKQKKQVTVVQKETGIAPQKEIKKEIKKPQKQPVKHQPWQWPAHESLPYRFIRDEAGLSVIDIYGIAGQDVYAVASGSVVYAGEGIVDFGKMLVIKHDDEYMSVYAHNSALLVKEGDRVQAGQNIAVLGATGSASQPKLYLEARFKGRKIDIKKVLTPPSQ
ncbi:Murein hydrolase activator EnvC [hydrothermal vent metagenome]|uniref:Murein hydrolase activator EnvC n=1 Tax=hydrothermal vent metagenome TaxID=652676 RepID=A0A3B0VRV5_9ZZZZ